MTRSEAPDEVLVIAAILGNLEAFEQLVMRYRPAVVRLAREMPGGAGGDPRIGWNPHLVCGSCV